MQVLWCPIGFDWPCLSADSWAAWVQAAFTVLVFLGSWWLTRWHFDENVRTERARAINDTMLPLESCFTFCERISSAHEIIIEFVEQKQFADADRTRDLVDQLLVIAKSIQLGSHPYIAIALDMQAFISAAEECREKVYFWQLHLAGGNAASAIELEAKQRWKILNSLVKSLRLGVLHFRTELERNAGLIPDE